MLATRGTQVWWALLNEARVPAGPVHTVPQALALPQVAERGLVATFADAPGVGRDIRLLRTGFKLDGARPSVANPPPLLGEHTDVLLAELGFSEADIVILRAAGAV